MKKAGISVCMRSRSALRRLPLATGAGAPTSLRVGEGPFITGGGFYIAREKGYFKKLGIDIQTVNSSTAPLAVPSLVSGELDIRRHDGRRRACSTASPRARRW